MSRVTCGLIIEVSCGETSSLGVDVIGVTEGQVTTRRGSERNRCE